MITPTQVDSALKAAGFDILETRDAALDPNPGGIPWFQPLTPSWNVLTQRFQFTWLGMRITKAALWVMELVSFFLCLYFVFFCYACVRFLFSFFFWPHSSSFCVSSCFLPWVRAKGARGVAFLVAYRSHNGDACFATRRADNDAGCIIVTTITLFSNYELISSKPNPWSQSRPNKRVSRWKQTNRYEIHVQSAPQCRYARERYYRAAVLPPRITCNQNNARDIFMGMDRCVHPKKKNDKRKGVKRRLRKKGK